MTMLHQIFHLCVVMLLSVFSASMALAAPLHTSETSFYQAENTLSTQAADVGFAVRAPPLAVSNIAITGGVTVMHGSAFSANGQETVAVLFGFGTDHIAPNTGRSPWTQVSSDALAIARDIENAAGVPIPSNQRSWLANQLRGVDHRNPVSDVDYANLQREYRRNRTQMIQDWEVNTGQSWPEGAQLHHVIPQRCGGPNQWWNAHPAFPSQHQGGIHGTGSPT